jgi:hypothetical protein
MLDHEVKVQHLDENMEPCQTTGTLISMLKNETGRIDLELLVDDGTVRLIDFSMTSKLSMVFE